MLFLFIFFSLFSQYSVEAKTQTTDELTQQITPNVIKWRRYFHQHPELSNREYHTAAYIARYLKSLDLEVKTGVAGTGVVAILDSGKPGPVVGLRADIDALPIVETTPLPFASKVKGEYEGNTVGVMHACGHDTHIAMLMGAATLLTKMKDQLRGKVKFIFQPAEEGAPVGEEGGAELMVKQGVLTHPDVDAIFGIHISSGLDINHVSYRKGGIMASVDPFKIEVVGKQAHGAYPWKSVDPIVTAAQIINGLQTLVSRNVNMIENGAVVTVGAIHGGNRTNIIPGKVEMVGTIRTLNKTSHELILKTIKERSELIAKSMGAKAIVTVPYGGNYPITYNDPKLMQKMLPTLNKVAGETNVVETNPVFGAEDFSFYQEKVPGVYLFVGGKDPKMPEDQAPAHHTPNFVIDERGMKLGVKLYTELARDYLMGHKPGEK